jgi:hypothetical protein
VIVGFSSQEQRHLHSGNVRAPLQAILYLADERMSVGSVMSSAHLANRHAS